MKLGLWTKHDKCIENASNRKATGTEWGMCFTNGDIETCVEQCEASEVKFFILTQKMIAIENWCCIGRTGGYRRLTFRDLFSQRLQAFCQFWMWYDRSYGENAYNFRHNSETRNLCKPRNHGFLLPTLKRFELDEFRILWKYKDTVSRGVLWVIIMTDS